MSTFERIQSDVLQYVASRPGCRRSEVSAAVKGSSAGISGAVMRLLADGALVDFGGGGQLYLAGSDPATKAKAKSAAV